MTPLVEATSKVIDLRDCEKPEFRHIWEELERIAWEIQGWPANRLMLLFGKAKVSMPIWSRRWEYAWAIISANLEAGQVVLDDIRHQVEARVTELLDPLSPAECERLSAGLETLGSAFTKATEDVERV